MDVATPGQGDGFQPARQPGVPVRSRREYGGKASVWLIAALSPFGDLQLTAQVGGAIGARPSLLVVPLVLFFLPRATPSPFIRPALLTLAYGLLVTVVSLLSLPDVARGEGLAGKGIRLGLTLLLWVGVIIAFRRAMVYERRALKAGLMFALGLSLFVLWVVENPNALELGQSLLHASTNFQMRPRILSQEASMAGASLVATAIAVLFLVQRKFAWLLILAPVIVISVVRIASRGSISAISIAGVATLLTVLLGGVLRRSQAARWGLVTILTGAFLSLFFISASAMRSVSGGQEATAVSDATRATWSSVALRALGEKPWGSGYSAPLIDLPVWLFESMLDLAIYYPPEAWSELTDLLGAESGEALAPKTLPATLVVYLGIPGLLLWVLLVALLSVSLVRLASAPRLEDRWLCLAPWFVLVATTTYAAGIYEVPLAALIGMCLCGSDRSSEARSPLAEPAASPALSSRLQD